LPVVLHTAPTAGAVKRPSAELLAALRRYHRRHRPSAGRVRHNLRSLDVRPAAPGL